MNASSQRLSKKWRGLIGLIGLVAAVASPAPRITAQQTSTPGFVGPIQGDMKFSLAAAPQPAPGVPLGGGRSFSTQQQVADYVRLVVMGGDFGDTNLWITVGPLDPSYVARDVAVGVPDIPFPYPSTWLVMIDESPEANWGHTCRWLFVDDFLTQNTEPVQKSWPPTVWANGGAGPELPFGCAAVTPVPCGGAPPPPIPDLPEDAIPRSPDKNCLYAILICGGARRGFCQEPGPVCPPLTNCATDERCRPFAGDVLFMHCLKSCEAKDWGVCPSCTGINSKYYVDNLRIVYLLLRNCGYPADHIFVYYSDHSFPLDLAGGGAGHDDVTDQADKASIQNGVGPNNTPRGIKNLCQKLDPAKDTLFIYVTNHGSKQHCFSNTAPHANLGLAAPGAVPCPPGSTVGGQDGITLWDFNDNGKNDPDECYSPTEFSDDTKDCKVCRLFVVMDQCYSGQFLSAATDGHHSNMAIYTAASANEPSIGRYYMAGWSTGDPATSSFDQMHDGGTSRLKERGGLCIGGPHDGQGCVNSSACNPSGTCELQWECVGGDHDGMLCTEAAGCPNGDCEARRHCVPRTVPETRCTGRAAAPCPGGKACVLVRETSVPHSAEGTPGIGAQSLCACCEHPVPVRDCVLPTASATPFSPGLWTHDGMPIGGSFEPGGVTPPPNTWSCDLGQLVNTPNDWHWSADSDCVGNPFHFDAQLSGFQSSDRIKVRLVCSPFYTGVNLAVNVGLNSYSLAGPNGEPLFNGQWTAYPNDIPSGLGFFQTGAVRQNYSDCTTCLGDMDGNGQVNTGDLPGFVTALVQSVPDLCADTFPDDRLDGRDIQNLVSMILANGGLGVPCSP